MHGEEHNNIISVKELHKYFGDNHILKGINFNVHKGQLISIIGRSGCGKTTLLRCLNCLEIFDSGTIRIAGITLTRGSQQLKEKREFMDRARALSKKVSKPFQSVDKSLSLDEDFRLKAHKLRLRVGMLFQSLNLFPHLTVLENVTIAPRIVKNEETDLAIENAKSLLDKVGLLSFTDRYPHQLSGGQAQRVAIARALAMNPQVMLYDEPTSALDPELTGEVLEVMKNLHNEGMTQVVVTHAMHFARTASDLIVYMEDGKIIETAPPAEIFNSPKDDRTKQYLTLVKD